MAAVVNDTKLNPLLEKLIYEAVEPDFNEEYCQPLWKTAYNLGSVAFVQ